jgi:hypothetical protein
MKFDHLDQKAALDVTANVVRMVLLAAKANHAVTDLLATVLPVIARHVMAKVDHRATAKAGHQVTAAVLAMAKDDLLKGVIRDVDANRDEAMVLQARGHRVVRWDHRTLSVSWKMRCVSTLTLMAS